MTYQLIVRRIQGHEPGHVLEIPWEDLPTSSLFVDAVTGGPASLETTVQAAWDDEYLYLRFTCKDGEVLATMTNRDDPLYNEEVVEAFVAPEDTHHYYEFNLSPRNVVFDSEIRHDGTRHHGNPAWDCPGLIHRVVRKESDGGAFGNWEGLLAIPFACLGFVPERGKLLRANFYRIKRTPGEEYMAWSPTGHNPAYFHVPESFGELKLI